MIKFGELCTVLAAFNFSFDVIILTEVKLKANFPVQLYNLAGYNRYSNLRRDRGGGGVIAFIKSTIEVAETTSQLKDVEKLCLTLTDREITIRLLAYYRAPLFSNAREFLDDVEKEISSTDTKTILLGDININSNSANQLSPADRVSAEYNEMLDSYDYVVTNSHQTRSASGKIIDHVVSNFSSKLNISNSTIEYDNRFSDHNIIITTINLQTKTRHGKQLLSRMQIDFSQLQKNFPEISTEVFTTNDADVACDLIVNAIRETTMKSSNERRFALKHPERINPWTSIDAIQLIITKDKLLCKRRSHHSPAIAEELKKIVTRLKQANKEDYENYVRAKVNCKEPKKMWRGLNEVTGRSKDQSAISRIIHHGVTFTEHSDIANLLNSSFTTSADESMPDNTTEGTKPEFTGSQIRNSIFLTPPSPDEVVNIVKSMKNSSAAGDDGISARALKSLLPSICPLIVHLITVIFQSGIFPKRLKHALVTPIFKAGDRTSTANYRPISVLSLISRIIERLIHQRLLAFISEKNEKLYGHQFGFRPRSGTENAAIELVNVVAKAIDDGNTASIVFMDLRKAFDIVDHQLLLTVLESFGIRGIANNLIKSFLHNRTQSVRINGCTSEPAPIKAGVVQGSSTKSD